MTEEMKLFISAIQHSDLTSVRNLVSKENFDINASEERGWTPLMWISAFGDLDLVQILIDKGSNVNQIAWGGRTPVAIAALNHHDDIVKLLVKKGAEINHVDDRGFTVFSLYLDIWGQSQRENMIKTLIELGAHK
jgi:ankyrin repeat protein